jgi:hypothetical protein
MMKENFIFLFLGITLLKNNKNDFSGISRAKLIEEDHRITVTSTLALASLTSPFQV